MVAGWAAKLSSTSCSPDPGVRSPYALPANLERLLGARSMTAFSAARFAVGERMVEPPPCSGPCCLSRLLGSQRARPLSPLSAAIARRDGDVAISLALPGRHDRPRRGGGREQRRREAPPPPGPASRRIRALAGLWGVGVVSAPPLRAGADDAAAWGNSTGKGGHLKRGIRAARSAAAAAATRFLCIRRRCVVVRARCPHARSMRGARACGRRARAHAARDVRAAPESAIRRPGRRPGGYQASCLQCLVDSLSIDLASGCPRAPRHTQFGLSHVGLPRPCSD